MNPINRRGQKVVCVIDFDFEMMDGSRPPQVPLPTVGRTYTVSDFIDLSYALEEPDLWPGILLVECRIRIKRVSTGEWERMGFPIIAFRPVDERQTDISDMIRVGQRALEPA